MATMEDKENLAPLTSSGPLHIKGGTPSPRRVARKGRSKSIGPGGLEEPENPKQDAKNRRKSTYVPATKSIISSDVEKAQRQAARRKTLANRRVSFAPEATLHTWDVVEFMRDPTTSTDSSDSTRRTSKGSPFKSGTALDSDPPSSPSVRDDESTTGLESPALLTKNRRNSGIPARRFSGSDDGSSVGSEDGDESESGSEDAEGSEDDTGTAMSLDVDDNTVQSMADSEGASTDSSARLEAALKQAATIAGTRGIEYDEYGDASMEIAGEEVTNAFKPWVEQHAANQPLGSASLDQENVNPFSPAFKAQLISGTVNRPSTVAEEETGDLSMDMTRAVGGVITHQANKPDSSPLGDGTMDLTLAVGTVQQSAQMQSPQSRSGQKRRRSTTDAGSPGVAVSGGQSKRRRSSVARSSMGDDTMDLTVAVGGIQNMASPAKPERRKSTARRRSSGVASENGEATMDFTQAVGGVKPATRSDHTGSSFDENEELTMELTTVLGGIKAAEKAMSDGAQPLTPENRSPARDEVNTTPKDQERFKNAPDSGPKKLLTPVFQKQVLHSAERQSVSKAPKSAPPISRTIPGVALFEPTVGSQSLPSTPKASPARKFAQSQLPSMGDHRSPLRATPVQSPGHKQSSATPDSMLKQQLDAQLITDEPSSTPQNQLRSSPTKIPSTPQRPDEPTQDGRRLADSIKLMSTPRKETLKSVTPKKQAQPSPQLAATSRARPTPKARQNVNISPAKQLTEDLNNIQANGDSVEKIQLQKFLDTAGIRFMDLTTTKRRMTTVTTPSKAKKAGELQNEIDEAEVNLESAVVAGGCTAPELEMYEHACHELKRYISDGKRVIKELEVETAKETPPLIQAYMAAGSKRKTVMDAQMRDIKTHARYRSKEMWYAWRTQLLEDLMRGLQGVGEGLIKDDATLQRAEVVLENALPALVERYEELQIEAERLEQDAAASATNEEEKEELETARERLQAVDAEALEKQKILEDLQAEMDEQQSRMTDLEESKEEFTAAIKEADRIREACRGVSINEITTLKESIRTLEQTHGWSIASASSSPATVTMTYKSQLQLFFHPHAFQTNTGKTPQQQPQPQPSNSPISLTYLPQQQQQSTTLRFFLQLLRASLQALPQATTRVPSLLNLVSQGWETALGVAEAERRLQLETMTETRIVSDERLAVSCTVLLPKVRSKVRVTFDLAAAVALGSDDNNNNNNNMGESEATEAMQLHTSVSPRVEVVYGEGYNEQKMGEFVRREIATAEEFVGWSCAVRDLRERLVARGAKGGKK